MKMIIYTRFSTDQQRQDSCADQERKVREGLDVLKLSHSDAEVINDEAISGSRDDRDGYQIIYNRIRAGEPLLIAVDDQSRLSRGESIGAMLMDLVFNGGRFISIGEGIDTEQNGWRVRVGLSQIHNSLTLEDTARRVRRGHEGRVLDGNGSAGDFPFGYRSEFVDPDGARYGGRGPKPKRDVVIYPEEAAVVRQVFAWFLEKRSINWIARELNRLKIDKGHKSTKPGWYHDMVRRILANSKYVGRWVWGKTTIVRDGSGRKKQVPAPACNIVSVERPDLRIIEQPVWDRAQNRLRELHKIYGKKAGQRQRAPRSNYTENYPKSLLGGLLFCGKCGSRIIVESGHSDTYFGCPQHKKGLCTQEARVPASRCEEALLGLLQRHITENDTWIRDIYDSFEKHLEEIRRKTPDLVSSLTTQEDKLQRKIDNLVDALASGKGVGALTDALEQHEEEIAEVRRQLQEAERIVSQTQELPDLQWVRKQLNDLSGLLREDVQATALLLRKVFGKVVSHKIPLPGKKRGYIQLRFSINNAELLRHVLDYQLPSIPEILSASSSGDEIQLDLGGPSRMDRWAPVIAEMRERGMSWRAIGRETKLGRGNAYTAWKRWDTAQKGDAA